MAKMKKGITKVVIAKTESESLRTTIPSDIVSILKLSNGDSIKWDWQLEDSEHIAIVRKVQSSEKKSDS